MTTEERQTLESYEKIAPAWASRHSDPNYWRTQFEKFRTLLPQGRVLDLGCGAGRDSALFIGEGYDYVGVDMSSSLLDLARRQSPLATFLSMNMDALKFPPRAFDGFWAVASLLHVPKDKLNAVLDEVARVVKPGGVGFVSLKEGSGERFVEGDISGDRRFFSYYEPGEFDRVIVGRGFSVVDMTRRQQQMRDAESWLEYFITAPA